MKDRKRPWFAWAVLGGLLLPGVALAVGVLTIPSELGGRLASRQVLGHDLFGDAGDVDGDGHDDLWVARGGGHRGNDPIPPWTRSYVRVVSGADPARTLYEETSDEWLLGAKGCASAGDVDGDGRDELVVTRRRLGATSPDPSAEEWAYEVLSIRDGAAEVISRGQLLSGRLAVARTSLLGGRPALFREAPNAVEAVDPVRPEIVLGTWPAVEATPYLEGALPTHDPMNDLVLLGDNSSRSEQLRSAADFSLYFETDDIDLSVDADLNGDGVLDVCLREVQVDRPAGLSPRQADYFRRAIYHSELRFHDGRTGEPLFPDVDVASLVPPAIYAVDGVGDVDGDGRDDVAVDASRFPGDTEELELAVVSVHDAKVLRRFDPDDGSIRRLGDLDGDGTRDFALVRRSGDALELTLMAAGSLEVLAVWQPPPR